MSYATYQVQVAPPWLQDQWGAAWLAGHGATKDDYLQQFIAAVKASFPELAPSDALAALGDEMGLDQGPSESLSAYATRLRQAWFYWPYAGTPVGVLQALHFAGFTGAVIVQQNGLQYSLTEPYTAGADPTANLVVSNTSMTSSVMTSTVFPYRTVPAGVPWFAFDGNTDFCSRFAVIMPLGSWPFAALGYATFSNTDSAVVTWPFAFGSSVYSVIPGVPNAPVILADDGTSHTTTQTTILASGQWTGTVPVVGYAAGVNPLNTFSSATAGALQNTIKKWKPAKATCMGVFAIQAGRMWDYPANTTWDGYGGNWDSGPSSISIITGAF